MPKEQVMRRKGGRMAGGRDLSWICMEGWDTKWTGSAEDCLALHNVPLRTLLSFTVKCLPLCLKVLGLTVIIYQTKRKKTHF